MVAPMRETELMAAAVSNPLSGTALGSGSRSVYGEGTAGRAGGAVASTGLPGSTSAAATGGATAAQTSANASQAGAAAAGGGGGGTGGGDRLVATRPAISSYRNGRRQRGRRVERWSNGRLMRHNAADTREDRVRRALEHMQQLLNDPSPPPHLVRTALIRYSNFASAPDVADTWQALQALILRLEATPEMLSQNAQRQGRAEQVALDTWASIFTQLGPYTGVRTARPVGVARRTRSCGATGGDYGSQPCRQPITGTQCIISGDWHHTNAGPVR